MFDTIKAKNEAIDILREYDGNNPYILRLKRDVIIYKNVSQLTEYAVEYVIRNKNQVPFEVGKIVKIGMERNLGMNIALNLLPKKLRFLLIWGRHQSLIIVPSSLGKTWSRWKYLCRKKEC